MTLMEFAYLLVGIAVGVAATHTYQHWRHRIEHLLVRRRVNRQLASATRLPDRSVGDSA